MNMPDSGPTALMNFPNLDISGIYVPTKCPRCKSSLVDTKIDIFRTQAMTAWAEYRSPKPILAIVTLALVILTAGVWLAIFGTWMLLSIPRRIAQKAAAKADAWRCVLSHCRACGLDWYNPETAAIREQYP